MLCSSRAPSPSTVYINRLITYWFKWPAAQQLSINISGKGVTSPLCSDVYGKQAGSDSTAGRQPFVSPYQGTEWCQWPRNPTLHGCAFFLKPCNCLTHNAALRFKPRPRKKKFWNRLLKLEGCNATNLIFLFIKVIDKVMLNGGMKTEAWKWSAFLNRNNYHGHSQPYSLEFLQSLDPFGNRNNLPTEDLDDRERGSRRIKPAVISSPAN